MPCRRKLETGEAHDAKPKMHGSKMGRGANWTSDDDVQLCKAHLSMSQHPVIGKDQKMCHFWEKIMEFIKKDNERRNNGQGDKDFGRTVRSCQSRWALINSTVSRFVGVLSQQEKYAPSGSNDDDVERAALEQFRSTEPGNKSFEFRGCWQVLKLAKKWQTPPREAPCEAQVDSAADLPGTPTFTLPSQQANVRPIGCKRAKRDLQGGKDLKSQLAAVHAVTTLAKKRARILQQQVALGYFKLDLTQVPIEMRDRFIRTRTNLMNELDADEAEADESHSVGNQPIPEENPDQDSSGNLSSGLGNQPENTNYGGHDGHLDQNNPVDRDELHSAAYEGVEEYHPSALPRKPPYYGPGHVQYQNMSEFDLRIGI